MSKKEQLLTEAEDIGIEKFENKAITIIFTPQEFALRGADENARYIRTNKNCAIVGEQFGIDRHIIRYPTTKEWLNYQNPYTIQTVNKV